MFILINPKTKDPRHNSQPLGLAYITATVEDIVPIVILDLNINNAEKGLIHMLVDQQVLFV